MSWPKQTFKEAKAAYKSQRARFHAKDPRCHWCKRVTWLPGTPGHGNRGLMATIDHLCPRGHPNRLDGNPNAETRRVLSCSKCNSSRPNPYVPPSPRPASLEEAWRAAGHWPKLAYQSGALPGEA